MRFVKKINASRLRIGAVLFVLMFCIFGASIPAAFAQLDSSNLSTVAEAGGLSTVSAPIIIARVIRVFLGTLGIIFTILVLWAGWIYMTAQGDDTKIKKAKDILRNGIIGMIICVSAYTITTYILNKILEAAGLGSTSTSLVDDYSEPLSGSLGAGIIDSHYPERNALEIPRNTRILVTFKEAIDPASIISGYDPVTTPDVTDINASNVLIYPTELGDAEALTAAEVVVTMNDDHTIFVFDPVDLLGSAEDDTNYTVVLSNEIQKEDGDAAFVGSYSDGYEWTFEVSTEVDLTPPQVVSVIPTSDEEERNITIEITFNEAMDPVAGTGIWNDDSSDAITDESFTNIEVEGDATGNVNGAFEISNGYKTIGFTAADVCGEDPCGDPIYCLPGLENITVTAHAATLSTTDPPQAFSSDGVTFDGLIDAAANSLDGDGDDEAEGRLTDDYSWDFATTNDINDEVPVITGTNPEIMGENFDNETDVTIDFSVTMQSSTLNGTNISLWADPWYEMWFSVGKTDNDDYTTANISHPTLVQEEVDGEMVGWDYYPVITKDVKSSYQICMFPAAGLSDDGSNTDCDGTSGSTSGGVDDTNPYCCNGSPDDGACVTASEGNTLPIEND